MTIIIVALAAFTIVYNLWMWRSVRRFFYARTPNSGESMEPVSILKPVKGLDFEAAANFRSFLGQDYPAFEALFGVESEEDTAVPAIKQLIADFPHRDIQLVVIGSTQAANRKVGALAALSRRARHELLVISDADVRVPPNCLRMLAKPFADPAVGMVTCLYRVSGARNVPALLESLMVHVDFLPAVLISERLEGLRFGLGATMAVRRSAVAGIGGFEALADYLADDYLLGYRIHRAGFRLLLAPEIVDTVTDKLSFTEFFMHQLRWVRTYRICRPFGYFASILTHGSAFSMLYLLFSGFAPLAWALLCATFGVRLLVATVILRSAIKEPKWLQSLLLLPLKEILSLALWALAFLGNRVTWRGKSFVLDADGRMFER